MPQVRAHPHARPQAHGHPHALWRHPDVSDPRRGPVSGWQCVQMLGVFGAAVGCMHCEPALACRSARLPREPRVVEPPKQVEDLPAPSCLILISLPSLASPCPTLLSLSSPAPSCLALTPRGSPASCSLQRPGVRRAQAAGGPAGDEAGGPAVLWQAAQGGQERVVALRGLRLGAPPPLPHAGMCVCCNRRVDARSPLHWFKPAPPLHRMWTRAS